MNSRYEYRKLFKKYVQKLGINSEYCAVIYMFMWMLWEIYIKENEQSGLQENG